MPNMNATRYAGVTDGYPTPPNADDIILQIDPEVIAAMDIRTPLFDMAGGFSFQYRAGKFFWLKGDPFRRRLTSHGGFADTTATALTITAQAQHFPVGTVFEFENELVRVIAIVDANTVTVVRGYAGTTAAAHASTVIGEVAGGTMSETDNWVYRPTSTITRPFNYSQMRHIALRESWRAHDSQMYGVDGPSKLDTDASNSLRQVMIEVEQSLVRGIRYAGAGPTTPPMAGGMEYYITAANGAKVVDLAGGALTERSIMQAIEDRVRLVGEENVARVIIVDFWGKQKISSFYAGSRRMTNDERVGGSIIDTLVTEWGDFKFVMSSAVRPGFMYGANMGNISLGTFGSTGIPHLGEVPSSHDGPFNGRYVYADYSFKFKDIESMWSVQNYSITT